jgi:DivIVA domain-containing protein
MTLTPNDVRSVAFKKPPLGKRGYDEEQVDSFLEEVERTIATLTDQLAAARAGGLPSSAGDPTQAVLAELDQIKTRLARIEAAVTSRPTGFPGTDPLFGR